MFRFLLPPVALWGALTAIPLAAADLGAITVYSARKEHLIKPVFQAFEAETGTKVTYLTGKSPALIERLKAEGAKGQADLFLTVDAGNLWAAAQADLLQPVSSPVLEQNVPAHLRDPSGRWFGLSVRARTIVYHPSRVKPGELTTYEDLATPKWKKRLCLRTSKKVYNQSLVAMLISQGGEKATESVVSGWVSNLAVPVFSSDTRLMEGMLAGKCDVGIVNSYYFGRLQRKDKKLALRLFWPNQKGTGVHVNVSGAGIIRHAKNPAGAKRLLEWLSSPKAQRLFADLNLEYPAHPDVVPDALVQSWGAFVPSRDNLVRAGSLQAQAVKLMDRVHYL